MNILLVDDSPDFRALVRLYLNKELDEPSIEDYDPIERGRPDAEFDWSKYHVVLLDNQLGNDEIGLDWLSDFKQTPGFPPTIVLTAEGNEYTAMEAIKRGAANYINKKDVSPKRLAGLVEGAADFDDEAVKHQLEEIDAASKIVEYIQGNTISEVDNETLPPAAVNKAKSTDSTPTQNLDIGYRFVRMIGQGAMSKVYLAERIIDNLTVVLKVLDLTEVNEKVLVTRFIQEAELIAEIDSPFVVKIHEHGLTDEYGYIAMEFFSRGDLKQRMEMKIVPELAFNYMTHVCYGLAAIHRSGVIHRDLKPANIMFRGDDSLALADFGISKRLEGGREITTIGQVLGTPNYMSPEQGEGKTIDQRSDIYSAGVMLYELLTDEKPFIAKTPMALIYQHINTPVPRLPDNLSRYQGIIDKALAKDPLERYQSALEFINILEAAEAGKI
jgi:serine/threonine protein kinase